jgi:Flp pilus assembly protein TadB
VGGRFWLGLIAAIIGIGIVVGILFVVIEAAFFRWGILGAFVFFAALALVFSWYYDRRQQKRYDSLPDV